MMADDLLSRAVSGDMDAFEELIRGYERLIYSIAYRMLGSAEDARDAAQETMIKIYRNLARCTSIDAFQSWVYTITNNTCIDELRKRKNKTTDSLDELVKTDDGAMAKQLKSNDPTPEDILLRREQQKMLQQAINKLSPEHRALIVLRDINGLSYDELSATTGASLGTVKSRLSRARNQLCQIIVKNREQNKF